MNALQSAMRRRDEAFTLVELSISVFVMVLMLAMAIPSLSGVLRDRRLRRSLNDMNKLVQTAQERSVAERRPYLITWGKDRVDVQAEAFSGDEDRAPISTLRVRKGDAFSLNLPAALAENPPAEWIFWPSGTCEPAIVSFKGADGSWTARYSPLTARAEIASYASK